MVARSIIGVSIIGSCSIVMLGGGGVVVACGSSGFDTTNPAHMCMLHLSVHHMIFLIMSAG